MALKSPKDFTPCYLALLESGELERRVQLARARLADCTMCARQCHADRRSSDKTKLGKCCTGQLAVVSSAMPHFGEEAPLVGTGGSGTIFFSWCNLKCVFCQNCDISQAGEGRETTPERLADMMLRLQQRGCHNINFVSPSHVVPQILEALLIAARKGLCLPLVYNTGGYDSVDTLKTLLDGVIDIYMPDMKYGSDEAGLRYSKVKNYWTVNREVVREMHRQVGDLQIAPDGIATRGLLVRHLVLPEHIADSPVIFGFLVKEISVETYVNVMGQYHPCYRAREFPGLVRALAASEFTEAIEQAETAGLRRLDNKRERRRIFIAPF